MRERPGACAALGTVAFAAVVASQILGRGALSMDELHTALVGASIAAGDVPSFYVGSVSRYEGGSWLIAFPVGALLALGAWATAATSWTAAAISIATVGLGSLWLARSVRPTAGLALGPLLAVAAPEIVHYSYRAWGSLHEALVMLPILALAGTTWLDRRRSRGGAVGLGALLGIGLILSYVHFVTALAIVGVAVLEAGSDRRRAVADLALLGGTAAAVLGAWILLAVPFPGEALEVRGGRSLASTLPDLLLMRLDLVLRDLPKAWIGAWQDSSPLKVGAAVGLSVLAAAAAVAVWRRGGRGRHLVIALLACLPALSVGHSLVEAPLVLRYYVPLLGFGAAAIAAWDGRAAVAGLALGALLWLPSGLVMPGQDPVRSHAELGANALHRASAEPHAKFLLLRARAAPALRAPLAFGYGLDTGTRFSSTWRGLHEAAGDVPLAEVDAVADPHLYLYDAGAWLAAYEGLPGAEDRDTFLEGIGVGVVRDGRLDEAEITLLATISQTDREHVAEGIGAALEARGDREAPAGLELSLAPALDRGRGRAALPRGLGRLVRLELVATPE